MKKKPTIFVCPLNWGIGHATRCVPIINELLQANADVIIGADDHPLSLLKKEFPGIRFIRFPGIRITYPLNGKMAGKMALSVPKILKSIRNENRSLQQLIRKHDIDAVISDNRYGLWSKSVPSIFITHQLFIKPGQGLKLLEPVLFRLNMSYISKFDECWIPDVENENNLSGDLSHKAKLSSKFHFIGTLSRFSNGKNRNSQSDKFKYDILVLLSGPEPQRSMLEKIMLKELMLTKYCCLIVQGLPDKNEMKKISDSITIQSHINSTGLREAIMDSEIIISRSGYSTVMDLAALEKKAILIPTPGQTEQEYLADYLREKNIYYSVDQHKFDLKTALRHVKNYTGMQLDYNNMLKVKINELVSTLG